MYIYLLDYAIMCILWIKIRHILLGIVETFLLCLAFLYSDNIMVWFSDFSFLSGTTESKTLHIEITWGDTRLFSVIIYNLEDISMTYKLWFVDAGITNDSFAQKACLWQNDIWNFGQYITGDTSFFTLAAHSSGTKILSVKFPESYTGTYHGCVMFFPVLNTSDVSINTAFAQSLPRRWGFIDALVHPQTVPVIVKTFPSNRVYQSTNNTNTGILKIYDTNKKLIATSSLFTLNNTGTGETLINLSAGTYYIVFKGQSHLASYLSGVTIDGLWWNIFDFTTGNNLYNTQQLNSNENDGYRYQTAWDLKNNQWVYDFIINGNDIAILTQNGFQETGISPLDPRNLNGDIAVNASDISVIGVNFVKTDPYFENTLFTW